MTSRPSGKKLRISTEKPLIVVEKVLEDTTTDDEIPPKKHRISPRPTKKSNSSSSGKSVKRKAEDLVVHDLDNSASDYKSNRPKWKTKRSGSLA